MRDHFLPHFHFYFDVQFFVKQKRNRSLLLSHTTYTNRSLVMIEDATKWHSVIFELSLFDQQEHLLIEKWAYILTTSRVA